MKAVSLLPAATEIVGALGLLDVLHGVSHECDWPEEVKRKPRITFCHIHESGLPSEEIDRWVKRELEERGTLYRLDEEVVRQVAPDVIFTQALCDVCAVDYATVKDFAQTLPGPPEVVNLDPHSVSEIMGDIRRVAAALGESARAEKVIGDLELRLDAVRRKVRRVEERPRCVLMEWIDPVYTSGHWGPELVELAGGVDPLGRKGENSVGVEWERVIEAQPEVLVLACCGYRADRTLEDVSILEERPGWDDLPAVQEGRVWAVDANAYFSRPGPRIVDSVEILASLIHPEIFGEDPGHGVIRAV